MLTESVGPVLLLWLRGGKASAVLDAAVIERDPLGPDAVRMQLVREPNEYFDDYLELVIEYGYVTLFASAFPLASALSVVCNVIEAYADTFKLLYVSQRPTPEPRSNIGIWAPILTVITWLSILTNTVMFGFTSDQMAAIAPRFFRAVSVNGTVDHVMDAQSGAVAVAVMWAIEHVLLLAGVVIYSCIRPVPKRVRIAIEKRAYDAWLAQRRERTRR